MFIYLSLSGIILSVILLYYNARKNKATIYLAVFFLLAGLYGIAGYVLFQSRAAAWIAMSPVVSGLIAYCIGPALYFYIRSILRDDATLKRADLWHLLPALLFLGLSLPYLVSPWQEKIRLAETFTRYLDGATALQESFAGLQVALYLAFIVPNAFVLGYVLLSAARLHTYLKKKNGSRTFASQQSTIQWMKAFLIIEVLLVSGHLLLMLELFALGNVGGYNRLNTFLYVLAAGPVAILLITFFSPGILYGLPRIPATANGSQPGEEKPGQTHAHLEEKPANRHFEDAYLQRIGHETGACMEKFRPYTNPGFNLAELSVLLHIPEHHLGYYFREVRKQSFSDYRSQWRVKHAKDLIAEGKTSEMTLEAIGLLSGFPNRDSFRTAFQRIEGMTPAAFVAQNQP